MIPVKQFFFDFGGVLVDLDFNGTIETFCKLPRPQRRFQKPLIRKVSIKSSEILKTGKQEKKISSTN